MGFFSIGSVFLQGFDVELRNGIFFVWGLKSSCYNIYHNIMLVFPGWVGVGGVGRHQDWGSG